LTRFSPPEVGPDLGIRPRVTLNVLGKVLIVVLVSCASPSKTPTPTNAPLLTAESVVDNWVKAHKDLTELKVYSLQSVAYVEAKVHRADEILGAETAVYSFPNAVRSTISVSAVMTPDSFNAEMRRGDTPQGAPADLILNFTTANGKPIFTESHWYPSLKKYRKASTENVDAELERKLGVDEIGTGSLQLPMDMFPAIRATCAGSDFFKTWLGAGVKLIANMMYKAEFLEEPQIHAGKLCYVLRRDCYDRMEEDPSGATHHQKRFDHFYITQDSFRLVAWTISIADVNTATLMAWYQYIEINYAY